MEDKTNFVIEPIITWETRVSDGHGLCHKTMFSMASEITLENKELMGMLSVLTIEIIETDFYSDSIR